jgi:hypothetical protein
MCVRREREQVAIVCASLNPGISGGFMMRWSIIPDRATIILFAALCTGTVTALPAQQPAAVQAPAAAVSGPRLQPEWPRFEPLAVESKASNSALLASGGSNHTFVFSTLALVLIGALVVILVLR